MTHKRFKKLLMARGYSPRFTNAYAGLCHAFNQSYAGVYKSITHGWELFDAIGAGTITTKEAMQILGMTCADD